MKLKYRVIERFKSKYSVKAMCYLFEVSRSGYYDWRKRQGRVAKDQWLIALIVDCQQRSKQTYGCRRVQHWLKRQHGKNVNLKAILRIMRKLDLLAQIRRRRPYVHYHQAVHKYPNLLKSAFEQTLPNRFWVTDITYIPTTKGMVYMCAVVDLCGRMVLSYRIGNNMTDSLVTDTIRDARQKEKVAGGLALHSDQGSQYTSQAYFDLTTEYNIQPSMSSPGCPYDNAAMENFFGTLKTECLYRKKFSCRAEVEQAVAEYVHFYNFERIDLKNGPLPSKSGARQRNSSLFYDRNLFSLSVHRGTVQNSPVSVRYFYYYDIFSDFAQILLTQNILHYQKLRPYEHKIKTICDSRDCSYLQPLTPQIRNELILIPVSIDEWNQQHKKPADSTKAVKNKKVTITEVQAEMEENALL